MKKNLKKVQIDRKFLQKNFHQAFLLRDHPRRRQLEVKCTILIQLRCARPRVTN